MDYKEISVELIKLHKKYQIKKKRLWWNQPAELLMLAHSKSRYVTLSLKWNTKALRLRGCK